LILFIYMYELYLTLMPVRSQFRPDLAPPPAAPCASVQSCRRSATATGFDHKSPGVREVCVIGPANRCRVLRSCHIRLVNCCFFCGPEFRSTSPAASSLIANHRGWHTEKYANPYCWVGMPKVGMPKNGVRLPDGSRI